MITALILAASLFQDPRADLQYASHTISYNLAPVASTSLNTPIQVQNSSYTTSIPMSQMSAYGWTQLQVNSEPVPMQNSDTVGFVANFLATLDPNYTDVMQENSACYYKVKFAGNSQQVVLNVEYFGNLDGLNQPLSNYYIDFNNDGIVDFSPQRTGFLETFEIPLQSGSTIGVWYLSSRTVDPNSNTFLTSLEILNFSLVPDSKAINTGQRLYNDAEIVWHRLDFNTTIFEPFINSNPVVMVIGTSLNPIQLQAGEILQPNMNILTPISIGFMGRLQVDSQLLGFLPTLYIQGVALTPNGYQVGNLITVQ